MALDYLGEKKTVFPVNNQARESAHRYVDMTPNTWAIRFLPPEKTRDQEAKYHAMIGDISKQVPFWGKLRKLDDAKRLLIDAFVRVMRADAQATGKPDPFPDDGEVLPAIDGSGGFVQLGVQSRGFSREIASEFIEYLYAYGSDPDRNVRWGEAAINAYYAEMADQQRRRRA